MKDLLAVFTSILVGATFADASAGILAAGWNAPDGPGSTPHEVPRIRQGGDTIADALPITSLPFHDTGTTLGYTDDYFEPCETQLLGAPDVVYAYSPPSDQFIRIKTCGSIIDTKLYVYEDDEAHLLVCNDSGFLCPYLEEYGLAYLNSVPVHAGHTYYIVVDGALYGWQGPYVLDVELHAGSGLCEPTCPPGAILEGEPECHDGYVDTYNSGCYSSPPVFTTLTCENDPLWVSGETGQYDDGETGDEDWYEFTMGEARTLAISACANTEIRTTLLLPSPDCSSYGWLGEAQARPFETASLAVELLAGRYWYRIETYGSVSSAICGEARYVFEIEGLCPTPTASGAKSWGSVKRLFR